jgi:hypothetical protein
MESSKIGNLNIIKYLKGEIGYHRPREEKITRGFRMGKAGSKYYMIQQFFSKEENKKLRTRANTISKNLSWKIALSNTFWQVLVLI